MCFSAQASFVSFGVLTILGIMSARRARARKGYRAFAAIPLFFAFQQLCEGLGWLALTKPAYTHLGPIAWYGFLFFAYVFWPMWFPRSLWAIERKSTHKQLIKLLWYIGVAFGVVSLYALYFYTLSVRVVGCSIVYDLSTNLSVYSRNFALVLYVFVTVGSCFISTVDNMRIFGGLLGSSLVIALAFWSVSVVSVWCFFAAALSVAVLAIVKQR